MTKTPHGWSYNPSKWSERVPIVALAIIGLGIATYLTLFQLGAVDEVWEPFSDIITPSATVR